MAKELILRKGTTVEHSTFTGKLGEVTVDTTKKTLVVHDETIAGGTPMAKESELSAHMSDSNNPHSVTKAQVGLENVDNTSDADKPLSNAINNLIDSINILRADKYLAAQNIANMRYTDGNLTKIQYNNATDVDYEVFGYVSGNLSTIQHYVGSVLKGTTTLSYTGGNLVSAIFVGV